MRWAIRATIASTLAFHPLASAQTAPTDPGPPPTVAPSTTPGSGAVPQSAPGPSPVGPAAYPAAPAPVAGQAPPQPNQTMAAPPPVEEDEDHEGSFGRIDVGLGFGWVGDGDLRVEPGFKPVDDLSFSGPVLGASTQGGFGVENFALAGEFVYERMLTRLEQPSNVSFQLFGLGIGAAYYLDSDVHLGAQLRYVGLLMWRRQIPCFCDQGDWSWGPGIGLTLGKEWFGDDDSGIGLAVQGNYAALVGEPNLRYASVLGKFTMTGF